MHDPDRQDPGVVLTAALTGPIATKDQHPGLPTTPAEIATAAEEAWRAGAAIAHVHVRDAEGRPTADPSAAGATLEAITDRSPILVQLSTGVGLDVPFEDRARLIELKPAMATLNVASMTFGTGQFLNPPAGVKQLAARMRELSVKPELELYDVGHLDLALRLLEDDLLEEPLQISFVMGVRGGMRPSIDYLAPLLRDLPDGCVWQVIAIGRWNLPMTAVALALGGNARTGLEDTLHVRSGQLASNAQLVERLATVARSLQRRPLPPDEAAVALRLTTSTRAEVKEGQ
jgi:3-keto-5-aminohexanoate cleavage enzyme